MQDRDGVKFTAAHIIQNDKSLRVPGNPILTILAMISIYGFTIPLVLLDISLILYQNTYFRIMKIPMIPRKDYIVIERWKLPKLNLWQRINCIYCDYANGLMSWAKDSVAWTEIHSCAIKNSTSLLSQDHIEKFYDRALFE